MHFSNILAGLYFSGEGRTGVRLLFKKLMDLHQYSFSVHPAQSLCWFPTTVAEKESPGIDYSLV